MIVDRCNGPRHGHVNKPGGDRGLDSTDLSSMTGIAGTFRGRSHGSRLQQQVSERAEKLDNIASMSQVAYRNNIKIQCL